MFCACRKDHLLACIAWQVTCFAFGWLLGQPLTTQQSVTLYLLDSCKLRFWRESGTNDYLPSARDRFRRGRIPLRCARNYHLTNQLPLIDHLISWLTLTIYSWTNVHPCKVSVSQGLKLTVLRFTKPTYPIIYTCPISLPLNLLSADSWCWCGISARGRQWCE